MGTFKTSTCGRSYRLYIVLSLSLGLLFLAFGRIAIAEDLVIQDVCGDGVFEGVEECDDGMQCDDGTDCTNQPALYCNTITRGVCLLHNEDGCDEFCQVEVGWFCSGSPSVCTTICGDSLIAGAETCDDGELLNGLPNQCNSTCDGTTAAVCPNGVVEAGEDCDDNGESETCDLDCTSVSCGDETINTTAGETCDEGELNGEPNHCNDTCDGTTIPVCPNGVVEAGEDCDDNGESETCDADCSFATCGDGTTNVSAGETCDDSGESVLCDADCSAVTCGDGTTNVSAGEECDDSGESASCDSDCSFATCGDGSVNSTAEETCDDGELNGQPNHCNDTCDGTTDPVCQNGVVEAEEDCDDGAESATCDADCTFVSCGDGTTNTTAGEFCDDAGDSLTCDSDCTAAVCPDGYTNAAAGEQCDDGDIILGDGCDDQCQLTTQCMDTVDNDDDDLVDDQDPGCYDNGNVITGTYVPEDDDETHDVACGDGVLDDGEQCDDGNSDDGDGCDANCVEEVCGNGVLQPGSGEECDDGNTDDGDGCDAACVDEFCGDGVTNDVSEECDDAGESAECDSDCTFQLCGDNMVNPTADEECDEGSEAESCDDDCTYPMCSDGNVNETAGEQCDDSNLINGDGCSDQCLATTECMDGVDNDDDDLVDDQDPGCYDNGNVVTGTYIPEDDEEIHTERCGNGVAESDEVCDDGNESNTDACLNTCEEASCGDGFVQGGVEECDDANSINNDACRNDCTLPPVGTVFCNGFAATIVGTEGRDILRGTPGDDIISGLGGGDIINGGAGNDIICGGDGRDIISGWTGNDILLGEGDRDIL
ncbi:DUF4215 domain-containing protein, partial [Patescibacteria group bacterium]|nr:DUF4215 domain-containing protein [Patescibacteria group bacterium]